MKNSNFEIDSQCPQCGAPIVLQETEKIVDCPFCRVRSLILSNPHPCYYLLPSKEYFPDLRPFYVPYWRFRGLGFAMHKGKLNYRVIDNSWLALDGSMLPVSLGLRSQTQRLKFLAPGDQGKFLPRLVSKKQVLQRMSTSLLGVGPRQEEGGLIQTFVGEVISLIYVPFYRHRRVLYDGISGKKIKHDPTAIYPEDKPSVFKLDFMPGLCPYCGWDIQGQKDTQVMQCRNCSSAWMISGNRLKQVTLEFLESEQAEDIYLPFWKMQVDFSRIKLDSYADFIQLSNIPKAALENHKRQKFSFFAPAFKINPKLFLRMGKQLNLHQPVPKKFRKIPKGEYFPATLALQEAFQAVPPILMHICMNKKHLQEDLKREKLRLKAFSLTYIPFRESGHDYYQPEMGWAVSRNALKWGRMI